ncbi:MAG: hypothetical protein NTX56_10080 [Proteobacteria bacterium]|nr:hypothetical protein [Pseudomonadota bacterium]
MAIDSSSLSMQSVTQLGWQQFKLQQAKRSADQAERSAQILQQQAGNAQREADRTQEEARALAVQSDQAQSLAVRARRGLSALSSESAMQSRLTHVIDQATERLANTSSVSVTQTKAAPVVNSQGQTTGKIINTTA